MGKYWMVLIAVGLLNSALAQEKPEQAIAVNPLGAIWQGLSYVEYERMISPGMSVAFRVDFFQYTYDEEESNYTYDEEGSGAGVGGGVRFYTKGNGKMEGFYGGAFIDAVQVDWEWNEDDNGRRDSGSGQTFSFSILFQVGYKIGIGDHFFIDPSIYGGYLSTDASLDIGIVASPALSLGYKF
jgi:hypothetical protein